MKQGKRIEALKALDPAAADPRYWERFRATVLERADFQLARRRRLARDSVETVLSGWSKSLIPVAVAAALVAAFLAGAMTSRPNPGAGAAPALALEDVLADQVGEGFYRAVIEGSDDGGATAFMTLVEAAP